MFKSIGSGLGLVGRDLDLDRERESDRNDDIPLKMSCNRFFVFEPEVDRDAFESAVGGLGGEEYLFFCFGVLGDERGLERLTKLSMLLPLLLLLLSDNGLPARNLYNFRRNNMKRWTLYKEKRELPSWLPRVEFPNFNFPMFSRRLVRFRSSFPCVDAHSARQARILDVDSGPEPPYARPKPSDYLRYSHRSPLALTYSAKPLRSFDIAYETWGSLSNSKDNAILLHTGLSASSHAAATSRNPAPGWWEAFIGPGKALDTNNFFVICTNVLGGCYGSTGPSSVNPDTGKPYGTSLPILSIFDMVRAQFHLLDHLGIDKLYASVGSSMGGMQSLAAGWLHPERVGKIVSISGTARSSPSAIAMRYAQRSGQLFPAKIRLQSPIFFFHSSSHGRPKLEQWLLL